MKHLKSLLLISLAGLTLLVACDNDKPGIVNSSPDADDSSEVSVRESGIQVTVQDLDGVTVHSLTAPEPFFANSTHIIETPNSLVLIDAQFLLPMALDYRAYADGLGKPIERLIITHAHPDHFLGSEAFADVEIYAVSEVAESVAANGQAEVDEKQAEFGDAIASTFVVPTVLEPGSVEIDGIAFTFEVVMNAEAEIQVVTKVPAYGIVSVGDIVYSGVHLILAGSPPTWTAALENLKADSADFPIVLAGHGVPGDPGLYDQNIAWLAKASELLGSVTSADDFKAGLVDAFPDLGMDAAIDFVLPFLFPNDAEGSTAGLIPESPPTEVTIIPSEELAVWGLDRSTLSFVGPNGLAIDADGFIYTTEFRGNRIRKLSPDGEFILEWGSSGSSDGLFQAPTGIFIGPDGNVYVSESGNHRIQKFTMGGDWLATIGSIGVGDGQFQSAMVLAVSDGGEIFASDWGNSRINVFDLDGNPLRTLASRGQGDGELTNPTGIKIGPDGNLWVVDRGNNRVQVLTQDGEFVKGFGTFGDGPGEFNVPTSIAFDDAGRVFISEFAGNRIQVFDLEHNYWGDLIPGVLAGPHGLVFDANGDLIVTDTGNNVIRKLRVLGGPDGLTNSGLTNSGDEDGYGG